eukprot:1115925-Alexandrium_andersonii.AAC.1
MPPPACPPRASPPARTTRGRTRPSPSPSSAALWAPRTPPLGRGRGGWGVAPALARCAEASRRGSLSKGPFQDGYGIRDGSVQC